MNDPVGDYVTTDAPWSTEFPNLKPLQRFIMDVFFSCSPTIRPKKFQRFRLLSSYFILHLTFMLRATSYVPFSLLTRSLATYASASTTPTALVRRDWAKEEVKRVYDTPLLELVYRAASVHRQHHDPSKIQLCTLMNIKRELFSTQGKRAS
jgi:hypothetical protein